MVLLQSIHGLVIYLWWYATKQFEINKPTIFSFFAWQLIIFFYILYFGRIKIIPYKFGIWTVILPSATGNVKYSLASFASQ